MPVIYFLLKFLPYFSAAFFHLNNFDIFHNFEYLFSIIEKLNELKIIINNSDFRDMKQCMDEGTSINHVNICTTDIYNTVMYM